MVTLYTFGMVPPFAMGLVRDMRVRWALEEAGLPYEVRFVGERPGDMPMEEYTRLQPFRQVPAIEDGELELFESGAIVLHIAEKSEQLLPRDPTQRAKTTQWMFSALNSIEPFVGQLTTIDIFHPDAAWAAERRPGVEEMVKTRLARMAERVTGRSYLIGETFTAADILMVSVLRFLRSTNLVENEPVLAVYKERCEARPAFQKALADHMAVFAEPVAA